MAHLFLVEDVDGDLVDQIVFCSDYCHREYTAKENLKYGGWFGCQEISFTQPCAECGATVHGLDEEV